MNYISLLPSESQQDSIQHLTLLGSTGSIGRSTLNVIRKYPDSITIVALAGGKNITLLAEQAKEFRPPFLGIQEKEDIYTLQSLLPKGYNPTIVYGDEGYALLASLHEVTTVLCAQVGASGLHGTYSAVTHGKRVALANKESLVLAGTLLRETAQQSGAYILPVDSEHSALLQAIGTRSYSCISKLILTASGGAFRGKKREELHNVTVKEALKHPTWSMGKKITVDSATMMNKGLEVIEAYHLFGMNAESIEAIIHPESIIHALIEFTDATQLAQLSHPSMELAIGYALYYPIHRSMAIPPLSLPQQGALTFESIPEDYRCYYLARKSLEEGITAPIIVNGANEIAVDAFLNEQITFLAIADIVDYALDTIVRPQVCSTIEDILDFDRRIRIYTKEYIEQKYTR